MRPVVPGANETTLPCSVDGTAAASTLLLVAGEGFVSTYELGEKELVIGRHEGCDVVIDHRALSRQHAIVRPGPPTTVRDLGSTNGTRIAGVLRHGGEPFALAASDSFHIGPFSFVLVGRTTCAEHSFSGRGVLCVTDPTPDAVPPLIQDVAKSTASVLILGETGVGKEVLAETVHRLSGRSGAFTRMNCAALSESLFESELFGHEKGASTGASAPKIGLLEASHGGSVFLDELGELPLAIQAKLLRAIEHREILRVGSIRPIQIDVRFISATNRDLPTEVDGGRFRRDLFFRLDGFTLVIPPLRERRGMIGPLAFRFLQDARRASGQAARLSAEVLSALEAYSWPGNVRELKAVIERALLLARTGEVTVRHLQFASSLLPESSVRPIPPPTMLRPPATGQRGDDQPLLDLDDAQRADRARLIAALEECAGNQTRAAKLLGIGRTSLVQKLRLYRIPRPRT